MSIAEEVLAEVHRAVERSAKTENVSPTTIALAVYEVYSTEAGYEPHLAYASVEHLKQIARKCLARLHDPAERLEQMIDGSGSEQSELFAEELQDRYPVPPRAGEDPIYRLRDKLSDEEIAWNARRLDKVSAATRRHADALRAFLRIRQAGRMTEEV
jgi:hypothetical protein